MQQTLHRHGLIETLRQALASIDFAFCKMNRVQFSAPWRKDDDRGC
jgi:hypothetical protein